MPSSSTSGSWNSGSSTGPTLGLRDAAHMMRVHPKTVQDLISRGVLPAARVGRAYVLMSKDVLAHIEHEIIAQTAERVRIPGRRQKRYQSASAKSLPRRFA